MSLARTTQSNGSSAEARLKQDKRVAKRRYWAADQQIKLQLLQFVKPYHHASYTRIQDAEEAANVVIATLRNALEALEEGARAMAIRVSQATHTIF